MLRPGLMLVAATAAVALTTPISQVMSAQTQAPQSPRNASYAIGARLDPVRLEITGAGRLTWRNLTKTPATELQFHLYWNGWRDTKSTWMREQTLALNRTLARRPAEDFGRIDMTALAIGQENLLDRTKFIAPDDGNVNDRTVLSVPLTQPIAPGQAVDIDLEWTSKVPRTFARTGRVGNYFFIAQWFPKIGVLTDTGWNTHQFHAATEFFSDFGIYDVTLTVPEGWVVGATGTLVSSTPGQPGGTAHRFVQPDVHDFAWTTSPSFLDRRERFEEPGLPPVEMRLLLQPEHADQADRHFKAARAALKYYGTWFGPYPYGHLTIVDPVTIFNAAAQGEGTRGMEYPTLFTAGTRWIAPWTVPEPEAVTVHEAGHQFWYGLVATNEFEHAWMDEGLNTYATARVMHEAFPEGFVVAERYFGGLASWAFKDVRWSRDFDGNRYYGYRLVPSADDQSRPSWSYWPGTAREMTYNKAALWFATLERMVGWDTMQKILSTYFQRGSYRHPAPEEFFAIANEVSGKDLTWFFDAVHRSSATFDNAVGHVASTSQDTGFKHTIVLRRLGDGVFPTTVRVTCGGTVRLLSWDGKDRWKALEVMDAEPITKVEVDPDRVLLLDVNYTNNSWSSRPRNGEAATKWALRWLTWAQQVLLTYAFFA